MTLLLKEVPRIGLGCMGMSEFYGDRNDEDALKILYKALELGYVHFDTADMYGLGHNESLLGGFLSSILSKREQIFIASKAGIKRDAIGPAISIDSNYSYIKEACDKSLQRLQVEYIDLYYLHRRNPEVPIEETMRAMKELLEEGKIRAVGLCEVSAETLRRANAIVPITAIQSEYSLWTRDPEMEMLRTCQELDIQFVAYSPIGRGFLTGSLSPNIGIQENDLRSKLPRFQPQSFQKNEELLRDVSKIANELGVSQAQISLAWLLAQNPLIHAIPGTRKEKHLISNIESLSVSLSNEQLTRLSEAFAPDRIFGNRYPDSLLKTVNV